MHVYSMETVGQTEIVVADNHLLKSNGYFPAYLKVGRDDASFVDIGGDSQCSEEFDYKETLLSRQPLEKVVEDYLSENPDFLDKYVKNHVSMGQIYRWMFLKEGNEGKCKTVEEIRQEEKTPSLTEALALAHSDEEPMPVLCVIENGSVVTKETNGETSSNGHDSERQKENLAKNPALPTVKTNRRKPSKPNRITSGYVRREEALETQVEPSQEENKAKVEEKPQTNKESSLPGNYFIERCQKCDRAFFSLLSFKLHACIAAGSEPSNCGQCKATFEDVSLFTQHVCIRTCNLKGCREQFFCLKKYNEHIDSHAPEPQLHSCQHCDSSFSDKIKLQAHLQSQHRIRPYQCELCDKRFTQPGNLKRHIRLHSGERPYKCTICQRDFSDQSHLKYHLKQHSGQKPFRCGQCDKAFVTSTNLRHHAATHLEKTFYCNECGKDYKTAADLKKHIDVMHKPKSVSCAHCGRLFSKQSLLRSHMVDTGNKPYTCKYCAIVLPCAGRIKAHARTHTLESPKYKCPDCDMLFDKGANLKSHLRTHLQFRPFECSECGKCFTQSGNLRRHLRIHSGEKPFKCAVCSQAFSDQSHLKYHTIQAHSAVRPFPCTFCGKGFITSSKLKSHLRVHDPERAARAKAGSGDEDNVKGEEHIV